jgi:hypothetical protein
VNDEKSLKEKWTLEAKKAGVIREWNAGKFASLVTMYEEYSGDIFGQFATVDRVNK